MGAGWAEAGEEGEVGHHVLGRLVQAELSVQHGAGEAAQHRRPRGVETGGLEVGAGEIFRGRKQALKARLFERDPRPEPFGEPAGGAAERFRPPMIVEDRADDRLEPAPQAEKPQAGPGADQGPSRASSPKAEAIRKGKGSAARSKTRRAAPRAAAPSSGETARRPI
ncbi:MAG: hypothetical protein H0X27_05775 [Caulobacteraceae bacterium]|nr:hypothetical protein [Caulobacteraceae bacterium]